MPVTDVIDTTADLEAVRDLWDDLVSASAEKSVFKTHEWLATCHASWHLAIISNVEIR